jgi:hypothetical protein
MRKQRISITKGTDAMSHYVQRLLLTGLLLGSPALAVTADDPHAGASRVQFNGIELPPTWPPRMKDFPDDPQRPSYLAAPPAVIPIDVGRQLLVDDFLVAETTLRRTFHQPRYFAGNPVLKAGESWEGMAGRPYAMPFSDGVWFDPQDRLFKLWYYAGAVTCYATSRDGLRWEKPRLDVEAGTNIVLRAARDSGTVWIDFHPRNPSERFKMALYNRTFMLYRSADGIHWTKVSEGAKTGDRSTFFYNPFRDRWVYSIRAGGRLGRSRLYWESDDFFRFGEAALAQEPALPWVASDSGDWQRDDLQTKPQLYNLDGTAYESVLLGLFSVWRGDYRGKPATARAAELQQAGRPKQNSVCVGFSRDGFHWDRPDRRVFIPVSEQMGAWNWGNVQSTAPGCLIVGDELWFYVSGRAGKGQPGCRFCDSAASTGLAMLRRDGFASLDAGDSPGTLTTRPVRFRGRYLFVNMDAPRGELRVEVLDANGRVTALFDREHCQPLQGDKTLQAVRWTGTADLSPLAGQPVRLRFHLTHGRLYSFWVTPDAKGASYGYVAGGGPAYHGPRDVP